MKNGAEVPTGVRSRYRIKSEGTKHYLVIDDASRDDTGTYSIMASGGTSEAHVQVDCMFSLLFFYFARQLSLFSNKKNSILFKICTFFFSETTENLPGPAGCDSVAGKTHKTTL